LSEFGRSLSTWTVFPSWTRAVALGMVPAVEVLVAGFWFVGIARDATVRVATLSVLVFSGAYAIQYFGGTPPRCGCLGLLVQFKSHQHEASVLMVRNFVLLLLFTVGGITLPERSRASKHSRAGFTIIEMICVIALVALLIGLIIPALRSSKRAGRD